jgi:chemotaxis protein CheX
MPNAQAESPTINVKLILPFMNSVREVFKKMAGVETTVERPHLKTQKGSQYEVCGIIGFSGQISGSVMVAFSDSAAIKLVEAFAGVRLERDHPDFSDAIGELANMIAGSAKQHLAEVASISVPSVVIGKGYSISNLSNVPCLVIPCKSPFGDFAIEFCIKQN